MPAIYFNYYFVFHIVFYRTNEMEKKQFRNNFAVQKKYFEYTVFWKYKVQNTYLLLKNFENAKCKILFFTKSILRKVPCEKLLYFVLVFVIARFINAICSEFFFAVVIDLHLTVAYWDCLYYKKSTTISIYYTPLDEWIPWGER